MPRSWRSTSNSVWNAILGNEGKSPWKKILQYGKLWQASDPSSCRLSHDFLKQIGLFATGKASFHRGLMRWDNQFDVTRECVDKAVCQAITFETCWQIRSNPTAQKSSLIMNIKRPKRDCFCLREKPVIDVFCVIERQWIQNSYEQRNFPLFQTFNMWHETKH